MSIKLMGAVWEHAPFQQTTLLVLLALADHASDDGTCWPAVGRIAQRARCSERRVQQILAELEDDGWIERRRRFNDTTVYVVKPASGRNPLHQAKPGSRETKPASPGGTKPVAPTDEAGFALTTMNLQSEPPRNRQALPVPDRFEEFWAAYPRKVSKPDARKAWTAALKRADADTVIDGAHRYAHDPNRDQAYTKHPGTWLRNDCWNDDPLPTRGHDRPLDRQADLLRQEMKRSRAADAASVGAWNQIGA